MTTLAVEILSVVFALLPIVAALIVALVADRLGGKSLALLAAVIVWGAIGAAYSSIWTYEITLAPVEGRVSAGKLDVFTAVFMAPVVEEFWKALVLIPIVALGRMRTLADGALFGLGAGIGFAISENLMYFEHAYLYGGTGEWAATVVIRTTFTAGLHALNTALVGAALGLAYMHGRWIVGTVFYSAPALVLAMVIHLTWNALASLDELMTKGFGSLLGMALLAATGFALLALLLMALGWERRLILHELHEEAAHGLIPPDHPRAVSRWRGRRGTWAPWWTHRRAYAHALVDLALLKSRARRMQPPRWDRGWNAVDECRARVQWLLEGWRV
ncbi:MAG: PrsW family glutamic-type intramembrane protease [Sumerlaeia bacterium]